MGCRQAVQQATKFEHVIERAMRTEAYETLFLVGVAGDEVSVALSRQYELLVSKAIQRLSQGGSRNTKLIGQSLFGW